MKNLSALLVCFVFLMGLTESVSAVSSDGLIWTKEPGIRVDTGVNAEWGVTSPEVVRLPDGTYRMYYTGQSQAYNNYRILSATSSDGINWVQDSGIRINNDGPYDNRYAYAPDIIVLPDGTYRMYYTGLDWEGLGTYRILSAISSDGLTWTKEGIRIPPPPNVTSGDTIILSGGTYRMYYSGGSMIISATSSDGLTWIKESGIRINNDGIYDSGYAGYPDIVELPDGTYRMYYTGYDGAGYYILSAVSSDGLTWTKEVGVVITAGGTYDSQYATAPNILELSGGAYRMYYTGYDGEHMRILSAISGPVNQPPVSDAGLDQIVEQESYAGTVITLDGSGSTDPDSTPGTNDDIIGFEWYEGATYLGIGETLDYTFPLGSHTVTLKVTDSFGETDQDEVIITVEDTTPPELACSANPEELWPPNHKMVPVIALIVAEDICTETDLLEVSVTVTSSEPDDDKGDGAFTGDVDGQDGFTAPVEVLCEFDEEAGCFVSSFALRAERDGRGDGRTYTIIATVKDASGNETTASCTVVVPHDQGKGKK